MRRLRDLDLAPDLCDVCTRGVMGTRADHLSPYVVNPVCLQAHWQVSTCIYSHKSKCVTNPNHSYTNMFTHERA